MEKILVVDDEEKIREVIKKYAEFDGYSVAEASNGMDAIKHVKEDNIDLVVLDVMMPELDGFSTCKKIREFSDVPVIMLSARGEEYDKLFGFETGVDDYVVKPFSPKELMARVKAVLSRRNVTANQSASDVFTCEGLTVDYAGRYVYVDGEKVVMTPKEYDLLAYLVRNKNIALTREKLLNEIWGYEYYGDDRTLDTHIKLLRNSLGRYRKFIVTLRGVGYRFETDPKESEYQC